MAYAYQFPSLVTPTYKVWRKYHPSVNAILTEYELRQLQCDVATGKCKWRDIVVVDLLCPEQTEVSLLHNGIFDASLPSYKILVNLKFDMLSAHQKNCFEPLK